MKIPDWMVPVIEKLSSQEGIETSVLSSDILDGQTVVLCGKRRAIEAADSAIAVGSRVSRKVCALTGATSKNEDPRNELGLTAISAAGADAIMDLSTVVETTEIRKQIREVWRKPFGICLTYDLFGHVRTAYTSRTFREAVQRYLSCDPDFVLVHAGVTSDLWLKAQHSARIMPTTSRGGGLIWSYMGRFSVQNPLVEYYDVLLEEIYKTGAVLDLGDVFRPGCIADAGDELKEDELHVLSRLRDQAMLRGVQVLCESGGHIPLDQIPSLITRYKSILGGAPLWLAGPLPTDRAVTLDAVANALGVSVAAQHGGDMFASITNVEHYLMPSASDTAESVRFIKVALDAASIAKKNSGVLERNRLISEARRANNWTNQAEHSLFPALSANAFLDAGLEKDGQPCTICGSMCPHVKTGGVIRNV